MITIMLVSLIAINGLILLGMRNERLRNERMLRDAMKTLRIVGISRGRHW